MSTETTIEIPVVEVHREGRRTWVGHRRLTHPSIPWLATCVSPPLVAWSRRRLERKADRWIRRVLRDNAAPKFTITADTEETK